MNHSGTTEPPTTTAAVWKQRYEALRQLATGGPHLWERDPLALVVLLRQGVAAWMGSGSTSVPTASVPSAPAPTVPAVAATGWQQQLTQVLAEMSLAHLAH